jgi:hypothetical protein
LINYLTAFDALSIGDEQALHVHHLRPWHHATALVWAEFFGRGDFATSIRDRGGRK